MRVAFVEAKSAPERLVCNIEVYFDDQMVVLTDDSGTNPIGAMPNPLFGMKLVGFEMWRATDGEIYVTFPSRAFGVGGERKYYDYLRSADGSFEDIRRVKDWIMGEFGRQTRAAQEAAQRAAGEQPPEPTPPPPTALKPLMPKVEYVQAPLELAPQPKKVLIPDGTKPSGSDDNGGF